VELKVIRDATPTFTITDASGNVISDRALLSAFRLRREQYEIMGRWPAKRVKLHLSSNDDGTVSASIYMEAPTAGEVPQDR
jgi:hypothetical protein